MKNERLEKHTRGKNAQSRPKSKWGRWRGWGKSVWERKRNVFVKRDRRKWDLISRWNYLRKMRLDGLRIYLDSIELLSRICWGSIENLSMAKIPQWIEQLSWSYQPNRNFLDGSRICREAIETNSKKFRWIEDALRSVEKKKPKGLDG